MKRLYRLLCIVLCVSITPPEWRFVQAQDLHDQPDTTVGNELPEAYEPELFWVGISGGRAFVPNESDRQYLEAGISFHYRSHVHLISLRINGLAYSGNSGEAFPFTQRLRFLEFGALYGRVLDMSFGHISFSAGIGLVAASESFPGFVEYTTPGFPVEIQVLTTTSWAGIGLSLSSNLNSRNSFAAVKLIVGFGVLK